ncbi:MAG: amidohydrolase family protein [Chitinophagaceae bacterium]|nr:amidohydrolase family protein [Chitinophagaceae bacterium]
MRKLLFINILLSLLVTGVSAQDDVYPAKEYKGLLFIKNATIHVGNGQIIENGTIQVNDGRIEKVGKDIPIPVDDVKVFDVKGKQVYPGLILSASDVGIREIGGNAVRGSNDFFELGDYNTNVRSIVAYNADSRIPGTLRANGILFANSIPQGGLLPGASSVVQLDAWNYEDAAYKTDVGIHFNMPSLLSRQGRQQSPDPVKQGLENIEEVKQFFRQAKAYLNETVHKETNLKFEATRGLFEKKQKFFVHCEIVREILIAIDFAKEFAFDVVLVGASECYQVADLIKQNNIAVILRQEHSLPTLDDDDIDQPFKTPAILQKAGVLFALNDEDESTRYRNLPFNAGTAVAYGLTKEQALTAITLNAAKILGIDDRTGSIEVGKDANIIVCEGDILDMKTSIITDAFIQGRKVSLENKQTQLYERYKTKYGIN